MQYESTAKFAWGEKNKKQCDCENELSLCDVIIIIIFIFALVFAPICKSLVNCQPTLFLFFFFFFFVSQPCGQGAWGDSRCGVWLVKQQTCLSYPHGLTNKLWLCAISPAFFIITPIRHEAKAGLKYHPAWLTYSNQVGNLVLRFWMVWPSRFDQ